MKKSMKYFVSIQLEDLATGKKKFFMGELTKAILKDMAQYADFWDLEITKALKDFVQMGKFKRWGAKAERFGEQYTVLGIYAENELAAAAK